MPAILPYDGVYKINVGYESDENFVNPQITGNDGTNGIIVNRPNSHTNFKPENTPNTSKAYFHNFDEFENTNNNANCNRIGASEKNSTENDIDLSAVVHNGDVKTNDEVKTNDDVLQNGDIEVNHKSNEEEKEVDVMMICRFIVNYPKSYFFITLLIHLSFFMLTIGLIMSGYNVIPIVFDKLPLDITDDVDYLRGLAWDNKKVSSNFVSHGKTVEVKTFSSQSITEESILFIYSAPSGESIFTKDHLTQIQEIENGILNLANYSDYCLLSMDECAKPMSILRFFDGTYKRISSTFDDPNFENVAAVLDEANSNLMTKESLQFFLTNNYKIDSEEAFSSSTRSILSLALPLKGYSNFTDREEEQETAIENYIINTFMPFALEYYTEKPNGMNVLFSSSTVFGELILKQVIKDFLLIICSLVSIVFVIIFQTRSLWITSFAIFSIISSFIGTNILYNLVLGYRYVGIFHVLAIFIILGIGADDIFIFYDTWRETGLNKYKSTAHRLSHCYKRAAIAMFYTSLTTGIAFLVSVFSPLLAINTFGVFCAILIAYNYLSVILFIPGVIIFHHEVWSKYKCCCCCYQGKVTDESMVDSKPNIIVRFFEGVFFQFITHKIIRWILLAVTMGVLITMTWFASGLEMNDEPIEFLKDDTMLGKFLSVTNSFLQQDDDRKLAVNIAWGLNLQNRSMCDRDDPVCNGVTSWNNSLDMNNDAAQEDLLNLCKIVSSLDDNIIEELMIRRNYVTNEPEIFCFMNEMSTFYKEKGIDMPISSTDVKKLTDENPNVYPDLLPPSMLRENYFEIALSFWMLSDDDIFRKFGSLFGEEKTPDTKMGILDNKEYYYGTKLKFLSIQFNSTLQANGMPQKEGLLVRDKWESFTNKWLSELGSSFQHGFQVMSSIDETNIWHWFKIQELLVKTAIQGIAIGLSAAIPILIIATKNIWTGLLASLTLCMITISVIGTIPLAGLKFGFLESLNIVLIVGLSVDYVVHLAEGYSRSHYNSSSNRARDMLRQVGVSVLSGAVTTMLASMFLTPSKVLFFAQFGIFVLATIGFSFFYSIFFFSLIIAIIGPQKDSGKIDIAEILRKILK